MKRIFLLVVLLLSNYPAARAEEDAEDTRRILDIGTIVITPCTVGEQYGESPQNVSVVEGEDIQSSGVTSTAEILENIPSVNILDYGADGARKTIYTRGLSESQVLVLVDGIPMHTPRDGIADLNKIDPANIEKIEVLRGPASSIYGAGAMGGVINIITKDGRNSSKTSIKSKYGLYDTRGIDFSHGKNLGLWDYYFSHDTYKTNGHRPNSDYEYHNTKLKLGYTPYKDNRLTFGYGYYQSQLGVPGADSRPDPDDRQESWRQDINLTWKAKAGEDSDILFKAYHNIDRLEFIENLACDDVDAHHSKVYGVDLQYAYKILEKLRVIAGYNRQDFGLNSSTSAKHKSFLNAGYFEGELNPLERLNLYFGARYDNYSNFGDRISPSGRFSWWLNDNFKLHGLYGRSFSAPTYNDLYWPTEDWGVHGGVEGNPDLGPEKAESFELGISTYFLKAIWSDVTFFRNQIEDLIIWNKDSTLWYRPENLSEALIQGVEWNSDFIIWEKLKANFNYTWLYAKDKDTKKWLVYRPQHQYKLNLDYKYDGWSVDWAWRYVSKSFTVDTNLDSLSHYWVADTGIGRKFKDIWEVRLSVKNLFDRDYKQKQGYPMPGRQFLTSLKCEF
jgi:outer membrane cobalamin receptor